MRQRKDLKAAVKKHGLEAVNSDEELNSVLDETQQERFIQQMQEIANSYMQSWKRMFSWLSLLIMYINILALLGMVPTTRSLVSTWTPRSVTVQFLISPVFLGSGFFGTFVPCAVHASTCILTFLVVIVALRGGSLKLVRLVGLVAFVTWIATSYMYLEHWMWGKHTVLVISLPLLCVAADTYLGARELATQGVAKLAALKYSHKKV